MKLPVPGTNVNDLGVKTYLTQLVRALNSGLSKMVTTESPVGSVLLVSPNGSVYTVKVTDAGVLETELVYDSTP
jgi:hypothetical protein